MNTKIQNSIALIQKYSDLADKYGGYKVAFSGGKDSQVMLDLFKKAGVNYKAHYNVTTNDPPENVYFIRKNYPQVEFIFKKHTYLNLIEQYNMLPTMRKRFCCKKLKESSAKGFVAVGVRRDESVKRAKYAELEFYSLTSKVFDPAKMRKGRIVMFRPILDWREDEIWQYIEDNDLPVNPCYETAGRVGCLFCPFASKKTLIYYANKYPKYHKNLMRTINKIIDNGYMNEFAPITAEQVWEWWISKSNAKEFFTQLKLQF